jgi:hypothetical protein
MTATEELYGTKCEATFKLIWTTTETDINISQVVT